MVDDGTVDEFPELGLSRQEHPNIRVRNYQLRAKGENQPLVVLHAAHQTDSAPVLLNWKADFSEPLLHMTTDTGETNSLVKAIRKHAPKDALVLAWWDNSRRLKLLTGNKVLFDQNLAQPLMLPAAWRRYQGAIGKLEQAFWDIEVSPGGNRLFDRFVEAMLASGSVGTEKLKDLTGGREAYLVVDMRDAYKLGNLYPDRFGIGFKDFTKSGDVHGSAGTIKNWLHDMGYEGYAIQSISGNVLRVFFFTDKNSQHTLLANLLPFTTSNPIDFKEMELVYQHKSYWIYRLNVVKKGVVRTDPIPSGASG